MNSDQNEGNIHFSWSEFEQLDELNQFNKDLEQLSIPDSTYRQLKELNHALIRQAHYLVQVEKELAQRIADFETMRNQFSNSLFQERRSTTESRLDRVLGWDRGEDLPVVEVNKSQVNENADLNESDRGQSDQDLDLDGPIDFVELDEVDFAPPASPPESEEIQLDESHLMLDDEVESDALENKTLEWHRIHSSANSLRQKSEVISAVFVELDQIVSDLNRQQQLMHELRVNQNPKSTEELDRVNKKIKRRFHRLSQQINN